MGFIESVATKMLAKRVSSPEGQQGFLSSICEMINSPQIGGLQGLVEKFKSAGLSNVADAWVAKGPNPAVSKEQLRNVFSADQLRAFGEKLGIDSDDAASNLSEMLPNVVDSLTPDGKLPEGELDCNAAIALLKQRLFGH